MYTRSVFMISWMTLVLIWCLLSACLWRVLPASSSCSSPCVLLEFSDSSSWLTRSCSAHRDRAGVARNRAGGRLTRLRPVHPAEPHGAGGSEHSSSAHPWSPYLKVFLRPS